MDKVNKTNEKNECRKSDYRARNFYYQAYEFCQSTCSLKISHLKKRGGEKRKNNHERKLEWRRKRKRKMKSNIKEIKEKENSATKKQKWRRKTKIKKANWKSGERKEKKGNTENER